MALEPLERVTRLSPLVLRVLGHNPGSFQLRGTNLYLVGAGRSRILIDAGEGKPEDLPCLLDAMQQNGARGISDVLITHYHQDHTEGIKDLRSHFGDHLRVWKLPWSPGVLMPFHKIMHGPSFDLEELGVDMLADGQVLRTETGDASLRVLATPGHTADHAVFVLEEESAVFSGDHVLGGSSGVFEDLHSYMRSLDLLLHELPKHGGGRIYPGHGPVIDDGHEGVCAYIANRRHREKQVLDALAAHRLFGLTPFGIVRRVYPHLSLQLTLAAASNVHKTLQKLQRDGTAIARELSPIRVHVLGVGVHWLLLTRWCLSETKPRARVLTSSLRRTAAYLAVGSLGAFLAAKAAGRIGSRAR